MAYRRDVRFIEEMSPQQATIAAQECKRVVRLIASTQGTMDRAKRTVGWADRSREVFDRRLRETDQVFDQLLEGYNKAGKALDDYIVAQREAQGLVAEGIRVEEQLRRLLAALVSTQSVTVQRAEPMGQWNDLRANQGFWDGLAERAHQDEINRVRADADRLYQQAGQLYDQALRVEATARGVAVAALTAARQRLPEFRADSAAAHRIIERTPGLRHEVLESARLDKDARRPGDAVLRQYQVLDDSRREMFPANTSPLSWHSQREVQHDEARLLEEHQLRRGVLGLRDLSVIRDEAYAEANRRFPGMDGDDDHNDAFRHTYANALMTRDFGEDWTRRFTTAHESVAGNEAAREAMDLYNNEVGRGIALAHPGATNQFLADRVEEAVREGRTVVVGCGGRTLDFSDQITPAETGTPPPGHTLPAPPPR